MHHPNDMPSKAKRALQAINAGFAMQTKIPITSVDVIWIMKDTPKKLPDGEYVGMVLGHSLLGVVVFSVDKADQDFYPPESYKMRWVNPQQGQAWRQEWLKPATRKGPPMNKGEKVKVRTRSGLDIEMIL